MNPMMGGGFGGMAGSGGMAGGGFGMGSMSQHFGTGIPS